VLYLYREGGLSLSYLSQRNVKIVQFDSSERDLQEAGKRMSTTDRNAEDGATGETAKNSLAGDTQEHSQPPIGDSQQANALPANANSGGEASALDPGKISTKSQTLEDPSATAMNKGSQGKATQSAPAHGGIGSRKGKSRVFTIVALAVFVISVILVLVVTFGSGKKPCELPSCQPSPPLVAQSTSSTTDIPTLTGALTRVATTQPTIMSSPTPLTRAVVGDNNQLLGHFEKVSQWYHDLIGRDPNAPGWEEIWGDPFSAGYEQLDGQPHEIAYYPKGSMVLKLVDEIPAGEYGRLTTQLLQGQYQVGGLGTDPIYSSTLTQACLPIVGKKYSESGYQSITYSDFLNYSLRRSTPVRRAQASLYDLSIEKTDDGRMHISNDTEMDTYGIGPGLFVFGHNIPDRFRDFLNRAIKTKTPDGEQTETSIFSDPWVPDTGTDRLYLWRHVIGEPISEAYWTYADMNGDGNVEPVLFQAFQNRVLVYRPKMQSTHQQNAMLFLSLASFTPSTVAVGMTNVGDDYFRWRYEGQGKPNQDGNCP
jgi:hypothetical protein